MIAIGIIGLALLGLCAVGIWACAWNTNETCESLKRIEKTLVDILESRSSTTYVQPARKGLPNKYYPSASD